MRILPEASECTLHSDGAQIDATAQVAAKLRPERVHDELRVEHDALDRQLVQVGAAEAAHIAQRVLSSLRSATITHVSPLFLGTPKSVDLWLSTNFGLRRCMRSQQRLTLMLLGTFRTNSSKDGWMVLAGS